jgi:hypothetical protein
VLAAFGGTRLAGVAWACNPATAAYLRIEAPNRPPVHTVILVRSGQRTTVLVHRRASGDVHLFQFVAPDVPAETAGAAFEVRRLELLQRYVMDGAYYEAGLLTSSLTAFEHNRAIPFEPAIRFVKGLKQAAIVAESGNPTEQRDSLRKAASNFSLRDRKLTYEFHKQWELVADQQFPDEHEKPAPDAGAGFATEIAQLAKMRRGGHSNGLRFRAFHSSCELMSEHAKVTFADRLESQRTSYQTQYQTM